MKEGIDKISCRTGLYTKKKQLFKLFNNNLICFSWSRTVFLSFFLRVWLGNGGGLNELTFTAATFYLFISRYFYIFFLLCPTKKNSYLHIAFNQTTKITKARKFMKTHIFFKSSKHMQTYESLRNRMTGYNQWLLFFICSHLL